MDTEVSDRQTPRSGANPLTVFITSFSAAIVIAGGFGIVIQAFIVALANLMGLDLSIMWAASAVNAALVAWLFIWTFARSWHVEKRLAAGLEVDEPKLSILANFRG